MEPALTRLFGMAMNETFRVGDLACVVRTCCAGSFAETGGHVGTVAWVAFKGSRCSHCGAKNIGPHAGSAMDRPGAPFPWLKRIDPHPEKEGACRRDDLTVLA